MVPLQVLWLRAQPPRASGTSLAAILPIAMVGAGTYYFGPGEPQLDVTVGLLVVLGGVAGTFAGSHFAHRVPETTLKMLVAGLLVLAGFKEIHDGFVGGPMAVFAAGPSGVLRSILLVLSGASIGILSGLTGVGGGVLMVPLLVAVFGLSQRSAQGTSLLAILPNALIGSIVHRMHGGLDLSVAWRMALAGAPAALVGAALALWLPQRTLAGIFGLFLLLAAVLLWPRRLKERAGPPTRSA